MKDLFSLELQTATTLPEIQEGVFNILSRWREDHERIGYVAGIVILNESERNLEKIEDNLNRLCLIARFLEGRLKFPMFCAGDVFTPKRLTSFGASDVSKEFLDFWRAIQGAGYITDMFMTPRYKLSNTSLHDRFLAIEFGHNIYYPMRPPV